MIVGDAAKVWEFFLWRPLGATKFVVDVLLYEDVTTYKTKGWNHECYVTVMGTIKTHWVPNTSKIIVVKGNIVNGDLVVLTQDGEVWFYTVGDAVEQS
jgi:hypothetical protein